MKDQLSWNHKKYRWDHCKKSKLQAIETHLYGDNHSNNLTNTLILNVTIDFLIEIWYVSLLDWIWLFVLTTFSYICVFLFLYINNFFYSPVYEIDISLATVNFMF